MKNITVSNGVEIPMLGLGVFKSKDGEETENAIQYAIDAGYRHIDTAKIYGNEQSVGRAIKNCGVAREEIFLTTKMWNEDIRTGKFVESFEESLEKLQTDYVDMYLIHWPADGYVEAWKAMEKLYNEKKIRIIGVSNFNPHHFDTLAKTAEIKPMVNQIESSPSFNNQAVIDYCQKQNIVVQAWRPFGGEGAPILKDEALLEIAKKYNKTTAQIILRWHIERNLVALAKSVTKERIESNLEIFDFELSKEDVAAITVMDKNKRFGPDPDTFDF